MREKNNFVGKEWDICDLLKILNRYPTYLSLEATNTKIQSILSTRLLKPEDSTRSKFRVGPATIFQKIMLDTLVFSNND